MKLLVIAMAIVAVAYLWWGGMLSEMADAERIRTLVHDAGPGGPLLFIALIVALFPVLLAGVPVWLSTTLWPTPVAIFYSGIGSALAGLPFFFFARHWGREWAQSRIPQGVRHWEDRLERRPLTAVIGIRLLFWMNPAIDLLIGVSQVTTRDYLIGTCLGLVPPTIFHVIVGAKGLEWIGQAPAWVWIALVATAAALFGIRTLRARAAPPDERIQGR